MKTAEIILNKEQEEAVRHDKGPLLIIAGAGTGKTTVVTERIKRLIAEGLVKPEEILALTFTEKAAQQMEKRVDVALPYGTFGLWISTFHSFCDRILRDEAFNIGLSSNFKLLTDAESYLLVKKNFWSFNLKYFRPQGNPYKFIEGLIQHFARLKDEDVSYEKYLKFVKSVKVDKEKYQELANAYKVYELLKIKEGVMDFADLINNVLALFRKRKEILKKYQAQFKYILVDEFQDTNFAQYQLVKLLAPPKTNANITVVGDDSQSIYKFRGAAISNILSFMKDYPESKSVILTISYRSPQTILDASYKLIKNNNPNTLESQLGINKNLKSSKTAGGEKIELFHSDRVEEEAEKIVDFIREYKTHNKKDYKDFAILVRANNHSDPFIRALERARIPYQFLGPGMLFHQPEIKDLIAYLKVLYDFTDSVSLFRVLSMDLWDIATRDLIAVLNLAKKANLSLFEQLESMTDEPVTPLNEDGIWSKRLNISDDSKNKLKSFVDMVHKHQKLIPKETAGQILYYFLIDSGLLKQVVDYKTLTQEKKVLNITKFFDKLKTFEVTHKDASVFAVVDYLDLAMSMGESPMAAEIDWSEVNAVNILTVHSAKGLEFPVVFLTNLIEGRFPSRDRRDKIPIPEDLIKEVLPSGDYHLQEERRLFYVGMTRTKEKLVLTASNFYGEGKRERKLSPFIAESLGTQNLYKPSLLSKTSQIPLFEWEKRTEEIADNVNLTKLRLDFLSYSAIQAFQLCPLHFKLRYILRVPTPPTPSLSIGNSIHNALRNFYTIGRSEKNEKALILKLLDENWIGYGFTSKKHEQQSKEQAKSFLEKYLKDPLHLNARPVYIERGFSFKVDPSLKILGKIDRVDDLGNGNIEIIDYKTGANIPRQNQLNADLQMTIYALAAVNRGILGKRVNQIKMSLYYFENSTKMSTTRTDKQLKEAVDQLLKIRGEIEQSDFQCSRKIICQNCEYRMLCNG